MTLLNLKEGNQKLNLEIENMKKEIATLKKKIDLLSQKLLEIPSK